MNEIRYINMCIVEFGHMQIEAQMRVCHKPMTHPFSIYYFTINLILT